MSLPSRLKGPLLVIAALFFSSLTQKALYGAPTKLVYVLNPEGLSLKEVYLNQLQASEEVLWLKRIYAELPIVLSNRDRFSPFLKPKDEPTKSNSENLTRNLDSQIKRASRSYFDANTSSDLETLDLVNDAELSLSQLPVYTKLFDDAVEILSLKAMALDSKSAELAPDLAFFVGEMTFVKRLPLKMQSRLSQMQRTSIEIPIEEFPIPTDRVFLWGRELHFPFKLSVGRYLVHMLRGFTEAAYWLELTEGNESNQGKMKLTKIWSEPIWHILNANQLRDIVKKTKPRNLKDLPIALIATSNDHSPLTLILAAPEKPRSNSTDLIQTSSSNQKPSQDWLTKFDSEMVKKESSENSILKSPWFWVASVALATGAGFLIYQATQTTTTVRTP